LPNTLHVDTPSPHIDWSPGTVKLLTELVPWQSNGHPRRAGVSSFGVSGTNAHVIVEEAPAAEPSPQAEPALSPPPVLPVLLSAKGEAALRGQAERLHEHLVTHPEIGLIDLAYSLGTTRSHLERRAVVVAHDQTELR